MKTAILTFNESNNNGALLQAYALQTVLSELTNEQCDIINYHSTFKENQYKIKFNNNILVFLNKLLSLTLQKKINKKSDLFRNNYLNITNQVYYTSKELEELNNKYDRFYSGSDQVWNPLNTGGDATYFLDFVKDHNKIASYAPSIAISEIPENLKEFYVENLNRFKYLSIREKSGSRIIKELTGRDATVVLDPTLLLGKEEWSKFANIKPQKKPYIFVYYISYVPELIEFTKQLKKETGLEVVVATKTVRDVYKNFTNGFNGKIISPVDFVNYILHADYVVTNSFHGTIFSVNFEKEFFSFGNKKGLSKANNRVTDFLNLLQISNRFINDTDYTLSDLLRNKIEYNKVTKILSDEREKSINYLKSTLID